MAHNILFARIARGIARRGGRDQPGQRLFDQAAESERNGQNDTAEELYTSILENDPDADSARWGRALLRERRKDWESAAEDYRELTLRAPGVRRYHYALARAHSGSGDLESAAAVHHEMLERFGDAPRILLGLATVHENAGEWGRACSVLDGLAATGSVRARNRLAVLLERIDRTPFELGDGGLLPRTPDELLDGRWEETLERTQRALESGGGVRSAPAGLMPALLRRPAVRRAVVRTVRRRWRHSRPAGGDNGVVAYGREQASRVAEGLRAAHALGRVHERAGRYAEAERLYRRALAGTRAVEASWVYTTEDAWRYRLDRVLAHLSPDPGADPPPSVTGTGPLLSAPVAGCYEAQVNATGLLLQGLLAPGVEGTVEILLDGVPVKRVDAGAEGLLRPFSFTFVHKALARFPAEAVLSARAGGAALAAHGAHEAVRVTVPGGDGALPALLAGGHRLTKKGSLAAPAELVEDRQTRYLKCYGEIADVIEEKLGRRLFLLYGTLLGCYRDGGFIAGDDDFDVAYIADATDPVGLKKELQEHALTLLRAGYDISVSNTGRLFKVRDGDVWLDISPVWFHDGRAWSFNAHALGRSAFEPVTTMDFLGGRVHVPADTEAFLAENYGPDWRTPQPGFRYYRSPADRKILRRSWLLPSELRTFGQRAQEIAKRHPTAGRYLGIGNPAETGFDV